MNDLLLASSRILRRHDHLIRSWLTAADARNDLVACRNVRSEIIDPLLSTTQFAPSSSSSPSASDQIRSLTERLFRTFHNHDDQGSSTSSSLLLPSFADVFEFRSEFNKKFGSRPANIISRPHQQQQQQQPEGKHQISDHSFFAMQDVDIPRGMTLSWRFVRKRDRKDRQLRRLARVIQKLRNDSGALCVLDLGGGAGRLGSFLAQDFGIPTTIIDKNKRLLHKQHEEEMKEAAWGISSSPPSSPSYSSSSSSSSASDWRNSNKPSSVSSSSPLLRMVHDQIDLPRLVANRQSPDGVIRHLFGRTVPLRIALSKPCCFVGVHACGSLSDAVLVAANRLPSTVSSFLVVPCCPQYKMAALRNHGANATAASVVHTVFFSQVAQDAEKCAFHTLFDCSSPPTSRSARMQQQREDFSVSSYARSYLLLANLHHMMSWSQFEQWVVLKAFHHALRLLAKKHPDLVRQNEALLRVPVSASAGLRVFAEFFQQQQQQQHQKGLSTNSSSSSSISGARGHKCDGTHSEDNGHDLFSCSPSSSACQGSSDPASAAALAHIAKASSFSGYIQLWSQASSSSPSCSSSSSSSSSALQLDAKFLDDFFTAHFETEIAPHIAVKCGVDCVAGVIEAAIFLDRVQYMLEEEQMKSAGNKLSSLTCGALFPASTTPRRFAIWGVRERPTPLLTI